MPGPERDADGASTAVTTSVCTTSGIVTPQAMGEIVDELEELGYVVRRPDPTDRRTKLVVLTERGHGCIPAGRATIDGIAARIAATLGERGHRQLRTLRRVLEAG